jgi:hypothetical protein
MALVSFTSTPSTAISVVDIATPGAGGGMLRVTHAFMPSVSPNLYEVGVTIENLTAMDIGAGDLRYRRVMDWDIEPTPFSEFVTIHVGDSANLLTATNDGFALGDPLSPPECTPGGPCVFPFITLVPGDPDLVDSGPQDHGSLFDFAFGPVAMGDSVSFKIFYGAAAVGEAGALAALAAVGAEVFSLGQCNPEFNDSCNIELGTPNTFAFGFAGVGGTPIPTPTPGVPEPGTFLLLGAALAGLGALRLRK